MLREITRNASAVAARGGISREVRKSAKIGPAPTNRAVDPACPDPAHAAGGDDARPARTAQQRPSDPSGDHGGAAAGVTDADLLHAVCADSPVSPAPARTGLPRRN